MPEVLDLCQQPKPETGVVGMRADCVLWRGGGRQQVKGGGGGRQQVKGRGGGGGGRVGGCGGGGGVLPSESNIESVNILLPTYKNDVPFQPSITYKTTYPWSRREVDHES